MFAAVSGAVGQARPSQRLPAALPWRDVSFISGVQQLPPSERHGQQQDSSPPAGIHLQGKTTLPKILGDSLMLPFVPTGPRLSPAALQTQRDSREEALSRHSQQLLVVLPTTHNASTRILKDNPERLPSLHPPQHTHTTLTQEPVNSLRAGRPRR